MFEIFLRQAIFLTVVISFPPLIFSMVAGLLIGVLQAATQIQEQTISYVVRLVTIGVTLFVAARWIADEMTGFFMESLQSFHELGQM